MIGDWTAWVFMSARAGGLDFFSLIILDQIQQFLMHAPQSLVLNYVRSTQEPTHCQNCLSGLYQACCSHNQYFLNIWTH